MVDAGIGRLLMASLHQGIADEVPDRLEFYENWLSPTGLRDGRLGLAPLAAVLSFLQREPPPADATIPARAGACAAEWINAARSPARRAWTRRLPVALRTRLALRMGRGLVRQTVPGSAVTTRLRRRHATIRIRSPLFDYLREPAAVPMRRYYRAAYAASLQLCGLDGQVEVDPAPPGCAITVTVHGARPAGPSSVLDLR